MIHQDRVSKESPLRVRGFATDNAARRNPLNIPGRRMPTLGPGLTCRLVAGARSEAVQMRLEPLERFVAGARQRHGLGAA